MKAQTPVLAAHGTVTRANVCASKHCAPCAPVKARLRARVKELKRAYLNRYEEASNARKEQRRAWAARKWPQELKEGR